MGAVSPAYEHNFGETKKQKRGIHYLKCWPENFELVRRGLKPFELRLNDRDFRVGDEVVLLEWDPAAGESRVADGYSGMEIRGEITCVLLKSSGKRGKPVPIDEGFVILGMLWTSGLFPDPRGVSS